MIILGKTIGALDATDLLALPNSEVRESRLLEFKETLPTNQQEDKKDFLFEVAGMVNGGGGAIIIGVEEERDGNKKTGKARAVPGVEVAGIDSEKVRLENLLRDGIHLFRGYHYPVADL